MYCTNIEFLSGTVWALAGVEIRQTFVVCCHSSHATGKGFVIGRCTCAFNLSTLLRFLAFLH